MDRFFRVVAGADDQFLEQGHPFGRHLHARGPPRNHDAVCARNDLFEIIDRSGFSIFAMIGMLAPAFRRKARVVSISEAVGQRKGRYNPLRAEYRRADVLSFGRGKEGSGGRRED